MGWCDGWVVLCLGAGSGKEQGGVMGGIGLKDIVLISASGDLKRVGGSIILGL